MKKRSKKIENSVIDDIKKGGGQASSDDVKSFFDNSVAAIGSFASKLDTSARVDDVEKNLQALESHVEDLLANTNKVESDFDSEANNIKSETTTQFEEATKKSSDSLDALSADLEKQFNDAKAKASKVQDISFYTHYGSKSCRKLASSKKLGKVTKRFEGWHYATQHNNRGGGSMPLCLIDEGGAQGGYRTGGWHDGVRPVRIEHTGNVDGGLRQVNSRIIPCSTCTYPGKCYAEYGVEGCKMEGYSPVYTGYGFAGYHNHWGNNGRICVDKNINRGEWNNGGYYVAHIYPTVTVDGTMKRSGGTYAISCSMCCKDE